MALLAVTASLLVLGSCATIRVFTDFAEVLRDAGYDDVAVTIDSRGAGVLVVSASAPGGDTLDEAHDRAAELVWRRFPRRFEGARITIDGERRNHTRAQLEETYGPRPASLDETDLTDEVTRFGVTALVAAAVGGVVVLVGAGLVVFFVLRARRRRPPGPTVFVPPGTHPPGVSHPTPWMPVESSPPQWQPTPGEAAQPPTAPPTLTPPPPPSAWPSPGAMSSPAPSPTTRHAPPEDRSTRRRLGRRPPGPTPPPDQTPPGWER